mgnify:FL=1
MVPKQGNKDIRQKRAPPCFHSANRIRTCEREPNIRNYESSQQENLFANMKQICKLSKTMAFPMNSVEWSFPENILQDSHTITAQLSMDFLPDYKDNNYSIFSIDFLQDFTSNYA